MILGDTLPVEAVAARAYRIPTDRPESDGTLAWDATTLVVADVAAGGVRGLGYTYADASAARLVTGPLAGAVAGRDALATGACWEAMLTAVRNLGRPGVAATAVAALDMALWDLKARLLGVPLFVLLGPVRESVATYASGGFTSYSGAELAEQLGGWAAEGFTRVKMKVGRRPEADCGRVRAARRAIGDGVELLADANGAYDRQQALAFARAFGDEGVIWLEEPVSSDDLEGLRLLRDRAPVGLEITAGEYGYDTWYFRRMVEAGAVDVLMADATRCGVTGFLAVDALLTAHGVPLSAHCAPAVHAHLGCAARRLRDIESFHDHARIEAMLFEGAPAPHAGRLAPDRARPGLGLELRASDAGRFAI